MIVKDMISCWLVTIVEICACLHVTTMMTIVNFGLVITFMILPLTSYWWIPLIYLPWYLYDRNTPYRAGRHWNWLRQLSFWKYLAGYFPMQLHKTVDLDPQKNYIFAFHPHGVFVFGGFVNFGTNATGFDEKFPGITMHVLVLNGQFQFPVYRDYLISAGFGSASSDSIDYKLSKAGPGHSVWLAIGGAAEVLLFEHRFYKLKILSRKGFIRKALLNGACIVPVFSFNETRLYEATMPKKGSFTYYVQKLVKLISNIELPIDVRGRPWCWYYIPRRRPINTVVGAPLDFCALKSHTKGEDPSQELIDQCHQIYLDALRKLYDDNKARFGDAETPLVYI